MKYYSTNDLSHRTDFATAVRRGLAPDGGLYMPYEFPRLQERWFRKLGGMSFGEIGASLAGPFMPGFFDDDELMELVDDVLQFDAPLVRVADKLAVLELFHGPTLAFKDFGARFMARVFSRLPREHEITILAATSGDTGSAVAHGFLGVPGIRVVLLYPSGKISPTQEMQMATLGQNIRALEVHGTFDDCQALVKQAFNDEDLQKKVPLSSANSINIARLIPQMFYYARALAQLKNADPEPVFVVPSGNFGNLTAGLFIKRMGAPIRSFVAATNANHVVPDFLKGEGFIPRPSISTLANAMDVGNPSNFTRMVALYGGNQTAMSDDISCGWASDTQILESMQKSYSDYRYLADPHTAVGLHVWQQQPAAVRNGRLGIILSTAHPGKFREVVHQALNVQIPLPGALSECLNKQKQSERIPADYDALVAQLGG